MPGNNVADTKDGRMADRRGTGQRATDDGNPGTLVGIETRDGISYARYRAKQGTWVSSSLAQQGYDKKYGKDVAYGAYAGVARAPSGQPLETPDRIKPGQEYLIPTGTTGKPKTSPPASRDIPPSGVRPKPTDRERGTQPAQGFLKAGKSGARLLEAAPPDIVAADPKSAGEFADPSKTRHQRENALARKYPFFGLWLKSDLEPTVSNFSITLQIARNDRSALIAAGMIVPGQTKDEEGTLLENGSQKNAFRHTFGQALITRQFGRKHAELVGFAHEDNPTIDTTPDPLATSWNYLTGSNLRYFFNEDKPSNALFDADTVADQLNNEIGRQIAEKLGPRFTNRQAVKAVLLTFKNEGLYVASFHGPGRVTIDRQRLTEQQYKKYTDLLTELDEWGLHPR
jgi:hypothetical protein